jgi:thiol-disulfide isomerase/thioredoxin
MATPEMIPAEAMEDVGHLASDFEAPLRDGGTFKLSEHHGRTVVLSFWASWCGPCRQELPDLSKWAKTHPNVEVVAVNVDRDRTDAEKFLSAVDIELPVAFDSESIALGEYGVVSMPTMFVVDPKGTLVFKHTGYSKENGFKELEGALK